MACSEPALYAAVGNSSSSCQGAPLSGIVARYVTDAARALALSQGIVLLLQFLGTVSDGAVAAHVGSLLVM